MVRRLNALVRCFYKFISSVFVNGLRAKAAQKSETGKVHLPVAIGIFGALECLGFWGVTAVMAVLKESLPVCLSFFAFSLLGLWLLISYINCRISYDDSGFTVKNFFGIKKRFTYDKVTALKVGVRDDHLVYLENRKIRIDMLSIGGRDFLAQVKKQYRLLHGGKSVPKAPRSTNDLFKGHVKDPAAFIVIYATLTIVLLFVLVFAGYEIYAPCNAENTTMEQISFQSFSESDGDILLISTKDEVYKIRFANDSINKEEIKALCDGQTVLTVYFETVRPKNHALYYSLKAILHDDVPLLSFEETNRLHIKEYRPLLLFILGALALWAVYIVGSIIVGRNPQKYGKKIVRLFFKDGYVYY